MNFLALNLADDIVKGKRSVEDARQFYAKTAMEAMKGQMSLYTQKLQFSPAQRTADELLRPRPRRMRNAVRHRARTDCDTLERLARWVAPASFRSLAFTFGARASQCTSSSAPCNEYR